MYGRFCGVVISILSILSVVGAMEIRIHNPSFESPSIDPNGFGAVPVVEGWVELDRDLIGSTNTGVFINTPLGSPDRLVNADGIQLAFLGSQQGNGFQQQLQQVYQSGFAYQLTVGVGISMRFPPLPEDQLEVGLYYMDGNDLKRLASRAIGPEGLRWDWLEQIQLICPVVSGEDACVGRPIVIGIYALGPAGGFWVLDEVRLEAWLAAPIRVSNWSFEVPQVDPTSMVPTKDIPGWLSDNSNCGILAGSAISLDSALDGAQLACIPAWDSVGLYQQLGDPLRPYYSYLLTSLVGLMPSNPPGMTDLLQITVYLHDGIDRIDVLNLQVPASCPCLVQGGLRNVAAISGVPGNLVAKGPAGIAVRGLGNSNGYWLLDAVELSEMMPEPVPVANWSFESPNIDPTGFGVVPTMDGWIELDCDPLGSTNTGLFINTPQGSPDRLVNADGLQLAFLGTQQGNAIEQDLQPVYSPGYAYRLTVGVGISWRFPPSGNDRLEIALFYRDGGNSFDIARHLIGPEGLSSNRLEFFSVHLPEVGSQDPWAGKAIGVAVRSVGQPGGFWVIDRVQLGRVAANGG